MLPGFSRQETDEMCKQRTARSRQSCESVFKEFKVYSRAADRAGGEDRWTKSATSPGVKDRRLKLACAAILFTKGVFPLVSMPRPASKVLLFRGRWPTPQQKKVRPATSRFRIEFVFDKYGGLDLGADGIRGGYQVASTMWL